MSATTTASPPAVALEDVTKRFGDLVALDRVSVGFRPGQVHAILGANGSGKSTLAKVMTGVYRPDGGAVVVDGVPHAAIDSPAAANLLGIRVIHQEAPLFDSLDVTESVAAFKGYGVPGLGRIRWRKLRRDVQALLDAMDVKVSARTQCRDIGPADRAGIALAIAAGDVLADHGSGAEAPLRLLLVDEVTAAIPVAETEVHLMRLRKLADTGIAIAMVTHRLDELAIADDVTVLRGGEVVYREGAGPRLTSRQLVVHMVGDSSLESRGTEWDVSGNARSLSCWAPPERRRQATGDGPVIEVDGLCAEALDGCSFTAASGEVVGFAGLRESGVESLPRVLAGEVAWTGGTLRIAGHEASRHGGPRQLIDLGMTTVPADRLRAGGVAALTISENIALPALRRYWHRAKDLARAAQDVIGTFDVRPPRPAAIFGGLSGGNQQKVLLGKWLMLQPRVLVLADPTYGVDPAAREAIFDAIRGAASAGVTVLFFSTEPEQLVRLCDRVLVMNQGRISTELSGSGMHLESIVEWSEK